MALTVRTEKRSTRPFLGSWRSKVTGIIYYNACTQTGRHGRDTKEERVQTEFQVDKFTDMQRDVGLQVNFYPDVRDRLLEARGHSQRSKESCQDPGDEKILKSVVKIQRFYRDHRGGQTALLPVRAKNTDEDRVHTKPSFYRSQDFVILNRTWPRTRTDFELLYNLLDRWRIQETKRNRKRRTCRKFLDELSKPVLWKNNRGQTILVDTPAVQRARYFRNTFDELSNEDISIEERIKTLSRLRNDIDPHTCRTSDELLRLIDQEITLLTLKVDPSKLNWLRGRLRLAFFELARNSLINEFRNKSIRGSSLGHQIICKSCNRLLPMEKFPREKQRYSSCCNYCLYLKIQKGPRIIYGQYEMLLRDLRRREGRMKCYTSLAFVVDEKLIYRLVNDIWQGRSAISGDDRLDQLRLVRFRKGEEWSPWNCLPLTVKEASLHLKVDDLQKFYGPTVLQKFYTKNLQAKVQFHSMFEFRNR
ncbi:IQ and ubiquitin-like domain-containing protein isoform X2 [Osmia bicornis bicornis]|uniref:IQ and ubiquitin-like domain-containing protein isoform X2 n=1 Tax=Osmia bicornis bicornis TaxID=1437191 RepID=UPI001EAECCB4|nr:IQ and ubiquitin-like domain-containing protein isoform X2 [Osmia bicornis bicornis]